MEIQLIGKSSLVLALLAAATFSYAKTSNGKIPCPSISTIQQTAVKLDAIEFLDNGSVVYTSLPAFYESDLPWHVGAPTLLKTVDEALVKGKEVVQNIQVQERQYAKDMGDGSFLCLYQPGVVIAIGGKFGNDLSLYKCR